MGGKMSKTAQGIETIDKRSKECTPAAGKVRERTEMR